MAIQFRGMGAESSSQVRTADADVAGSFKELPIIHSIRPLRLPMITGVPVSPNAREGPNHQEHPPDQSLHP